MGLDTVELVMALEEEFDLPFPDDKTAKMRTVRHVRDFVVAEYTALGRAADPEAIFERIRKLTVDQTNVRPEQVQLDSAFVDDLGMA